MTSILLSVVEEEKERKKRKKGRERERSLLSNRKLKH